MSLVKNEEKKKRKKKHHSEHSQHHTHHKIPQNVEVVPIKKTHHHKKKIKRTIFERYKLQDNWNFLIKKLIRVTRIEHLSQIQFYDSSCRQFANFRLSCFFYKWKYKRNWVHFFRSLRALKMERIAINMRHNWPILAAKAKKRITQIDKISAFHEFIEDEKLPNIFFLWKSKYLKKSRATLNWKNLTKNMIKQENQKNISEEQKTRRIFAKWLYYKSYLIYSYNRWVFSYARRKYDRALIFQSIAYRYLHSFYYENLVEGEIYIRRQRKWKEMSVRVLINHTLEMATRGKKYLHSANKIILLKQKIVHKDYCERLMNAQKNLEKERNYEIIHEFINKWNEKAKIKTYARKFTKAHLKGVLRDYSRHVQNRAALTIQNWWLGILHRKNSNALLMQNVLYEWRQISQKLAYSMYEAPEMSLVMKRPFSISLQPFVSIENNEFDVFRDSVDFAYEENMILAENVGMEVGDMIDDILFIPKLSSNKTPPLNNFVLEIDVPSDVTHYDVDFDLWEIMYYSTDRILPPLIDYNKDKQIPINEKLLRIVSKQRLNAKPSFIVPNIFDGIMPIQRIQNTPLEKDIRCRTFDPTDVYDISYLDKAFSDKTFTKMVVKPVEHLEASRFSLIFEFNDKSYDVLENSFDNAITSIVRRAFVFKFDVTQLDLGYLRNSKEFGFDRLVMTSSFNNAINKAVKENVLKNVEPFERYASIGVEHAFTKPRVTFVFETEYRGLPKMNISALKNYILRNAGNAIMNIITDSIFAPDIRIVDEFREKFEMNADIIGQIDKTFNDYIFGSLQGLVSNNINSIDIEITNEELLSHLIPGNDASQQSQNNMSLHRYSVNKTLFEEEEEEEEEETNDKRLLPSQNQKPIYIPKPIHQLLLSNQDKDTEKDEEEEEEDKGEKSMQISDITTSREPPDFDFEEDESTEILPTDILDVNPGDIIRSPPQTKSTSTTSTLSFDDETIETTTTTTTTTSYSNRSQSIDSSNSSQVITDIILDVRTVIDQIDLSFSAVIIDITQESIKLPFIQPINTEYSLILDQTSNKTNNKKPHFQIDSNFTKKTLSKKPGKIQTIPTISDDSDITYDTMTIDLSTTITSDEPGATTMNTMNTITFDSDSLANRLNLPTQMLEKRPSVVDDNEPPSQDFVKPPTSVFVSPSPQKNDALPLPEPLNAPNSPFNQGAGNNSDIQQTNNSQSYTTAEQTAGNDNTYFSMTTDSITQDGRDNKDDKSDKDQTSFMKDTTEIENLNISNIPAIAPSPHKPIGSRLIEEEEMFEKILGHSNSNSRDMSFNNSKDSFPITNQTLDKWTTDFVNSLLPFKQEKIKDNQQSMIDLQTTNDIIGNPFDQWINDFIINDVIPVVAKEKSTSNRTPQKAKQNDQKQKPSSQKATKKKAPATNTTSDSYEALDINTLINDDFYDILNEGIGFITRNILPDVRQNIPAPIQNDDRRSTTEIDPIEMGSDSESKVIPNPHSTPETSEDDFQFETVDTTQPKGKEKKDDNKQKRVQSPMRKSSKKVKQSDEPESLDYNQFNRLFLDSLFKVTNDAADNLLFRFQHFAQNT